MSTFMGFTEEDLIRIKSADSGADNGINILEKVTPVNIKRIDKIGAKLKRPLQIDKFKTQTSDEAIDSIAFDKCRLSLNSPQNDHQIISHNIDDTVGTENKIEDIDLSRDSSDEDGITVVSRKSSTDVTPDIVKEITELTDYDEYDQQTNVVDHKVKLEGLQLKQKLMEEQNKKRKEMLSKALADRTKQTEEEVMKLEKIKRELQVLDGQFSQDVAVLRKKIDQACLSYAETEKHYLKVEKEFLQAKINLQKEREKKELLTEHLCALITHNETRKAKKLETLMSQLIDDKKSDEEIDDDESIIVDGVDVRTGKMVEINNTDS